ncbi:inorganic polyphosphate kinase [Leucobacter sp. UCD-THU]|jgi:NAD+ kinase|uniref:NAD kinase n=1 Tax=Leucobacter muris TaxID=1935379 RepID=A0ABX5QCV5_9MICO|nr:MULTISPECIES: NAD kinase [Leucobacter]EYT56710.1 inorganic polyphosphate kinase [Leucobacter sp. UCD-THU]QAB16895.1 NAD kinase [Leucobacter muris]
MSTAHEAGTRRFLVVSHTHRDEAVAATVEAVSALRAAGAEPVLDRHDRQEFAPHLNIESIAELGRDVTIHELEAAIVLGGDGTILRAAELLRGSECPIVGVNLGHVGFLAEMENYDLAETIDRVLRRDYTVEERMTVDVQATCDGEVIAETWALNEASVEKRRRMLEVEIGVDGLPVSNFACDGVVLATPTGSTAYAFSAGGPVVWPTVQAMLMVPIAAHALFDRPLVTGTDSELSVRILPENIGPGVMWCDGRRRTELPAGSIVRVRRSAHSVRLARLNRAMFSDRLVRKFHLPVSGWRGTRRESGGAE